MQKHFGGGNHHMNPPSIPDAQVFVLDMKSVNIQHLKSSSKLQQE